MTTPTLIIDLLRAYEAAKASSRKAADRLDRAEERHGTADAGFRHLKVVLADAIEWEARSRVAHLRRQILERPVTCAAELRALRTVCRDTPRWTDARQALKAARESLPA